jgi:hypothetical protein
VKALHIWMNNDILDMDVQHVTLDGTLRALNEQENIIHTTQPHVCSTTWLVKGYKIFVHMLDGEVVEITLGDNNKHTNRNIGVRHNLEKLLLANEFGKATEDNI